MYVRFGNLKAAVLCAGLTASSTVAADWPTYGHDVHRSAISPERLTVPLSEEWTFIPIHPPSHAWGDPQPKEVEGKLELPRLRFDDAFHVAAVGDLVYFGSSSDNKVYALNAATGGISWEFFTGGPVRLAPTLWNHKLYVGSDDGKVYCIDARNGRLKWSFTAAPDSKMVLGNGKMISLWPVRTDVLVDGGVAYCAAGVFPAEGLYVYALRAEDGKLLWKSDTGNHRKGLGISPQGYLVASDDRLFVPAGRTMPVAFSRRDGRFLFQRFPPERMFGGTYTLLAGDLVLNGTEHVIALQESDGAFVFTDEVRRLIAADDAVYLLTGNEAVAVERREWECATGQGQRLRKTRTRLAKVRAQRKEAETRLSDTVAPKKEDLEQEVSKLTAKETDLEGQLREGAKWCVTCECADSMALTRTILFVGGAGMVKGIDTAEGREVWSAEVNGKARGLAVANGRLLVSTDEGAIHCFVQGENARGLKAGPRAVDNAFGRDPAAALYAATAKRIIEESDVKRGYALLLGDAGRLALELTRRTELMIYMVTPDDNKAGEARRALNAAGVYGGRVAVILNPLDRLPFPDYFANLIVCESDSSGAIPTPAGEILRMLKPCGGVAFIGRSCAAPTRKSLHGRLCEKRVTKRWLRELRGQLSTLGEESTRISVSRGVAKITRGALNGAGSWTHQYADPGNTACSDDLLVRGPIGVLWFGEPGPGRMPSRHASAASPLAIGGRMFVQGENVIMAYDAYNGLLLWERDIPGAMRLGVKYGGSSNLAANDDSLFVVAQGKCLRLDAATGKTLETYRGPPGPDEEPVDWGDYIACVGGLLYGSHQVCASAPDIKGGRGETNSVFAVDIDTGRPMWTYGEKEIILNTICIGGNRMFFLQHGMTSEQRERCLEGIQHEMRTDRRGKPIAPDIRLVVALDAQTGTKIWERPQYVSDCVGVSKGGGDLTAMYSDNVLLLCGQPWNGHFWREFIAGKFSRRSLIALAGDDGRTLWSGRKGYRSRPIIVGGLIYAEPWAYDLKTGAEKMRIHPLTGSMTKWQMSRPGHHCGNICAAPNALFFRSGPVAYYDLDADFGTAHLAGQRPGCWINIVPANGVVMMPEASSGCVCPYPLHCTTVYRPRAANRLWGVFSAAGRVTMTRRLALNFGAPGDRRAADGTLWLGYPRPYKSPMQNHRLAFDLVIDMQRHGSGGFFSRDADFLKIGGTDDAWIYGSGLEGALHANVDLRYVVPGAVSMHVDQPLRIDARHDELAWDGFRRLYVRDGSSVWLRHDSRNLYIASCRRAANGPDGPIPWKSETEGTDAPVWKDDSFEVYISDTNLETCLHLGVSASGARYDGAWEYVEPVFPTFDLPPLEHIEIDGEADDWGDNGFRVRSLAGQGKQMRAPADFDPSFRAGWNEKGLLLLVEVRDDVIDEDEKPANMWKADCIEILMSLGRGAAEHYQIQIAVGTGADSTYPETRTHLSDNRGGVADTKLSAEAEGKKTADGYLVEVLLPWTNMAITPVLGLQFGLQLFINDADGKGGYPKDWFRASWHPGGHPSKNHDAYQLMRLAAQRGPFVEFKRSKKPGEDGLFAVDKPYPFPIEATSLGSRGEDSSYNGKWSVAVRTGEGKKDATKTRTTFSTEWAVPWDTLTGVGLKKEELIISVSTRGRLPRAPRIGREFSRLVLVEPETGSPGYYTVRLLFAELDTVKPGERVFDVKLQGRTVLEDFDIVVAAGGRNRAISREFRRIAAGMTMSVELIPKTEQTAPSSRPVISGIEILETTER